METKAKKEWAKETLRSKKRRKTRKKERGGKEKNYDIEE